MSDCPGKMWPGRYEGWTGVAGGGQAAGGIVGCGWRAGTGTGLRRLEGITDLGLSGCGGPGGRAPAPPNSAADFRPRLT